SGVFAGARNTRFNQIQARIPDLSDAVVAVTAEARGPLAEMLGTVKTSPLAALTQQALDRASGAGNADLRLNLRLPIHALHTTSVRGSVALAGNEVRITP